MAGRARLGTVGPGEARGALVLVFAVAYLLETFRMVRDPAELGTGRDAASGRDLVLYTDRG